MKDELKEKIFKNAISLAKQGLYDLAWKRKDALNLIHELQNENIGILGGDVYRLTNLDLQITGDNWLCDEFNDLSKERFNFKSKNLSYQYIKNYPEQSEDLIFCIAFTEQII